MPSLLLAPAGSGKTHHIIQRIRELRAGQPLASVMVLLPNRLLALEFRRRLAASGGTLGVQVFTFYELYADILARAGQPLPCLPDPLQIRILRALVDELCDIGEIQHYASLRARPGFILALRNTIQELKQARILPEAFAAAVRDSETRLTELAVFYAAYQNWLQTHGWLDPEGQGWLAALALERNPALGRELCLLAVDSFDEFNPTQLSVLSALAPRAAETLITLTGDAAHPRPLAHCRFHHALAALTASLPLEVQPLFSTHSNHPLEPELFTTQTPANQACNHAITQSPANKVCHHQFIEAQSRPAETRAALRWIKACIVRDGLQPGETAIIARSIEPYRPFIEEIAAEFGLPLYFTAGQPLMRNPAIAALLDLLALPAERHATPAWPRRSLLEAWRSPYFDWTPLGIDAALTAQLDEASRLGRVTGGLAQWSEAIARWASRQSAADEDGELAETPVNQNGAALQNAFDTFVNRLTPPAHARLREFIAFIEDLIGDDQPLLPPHPWVSDGEGRGGVGIAVRARAHPATAERDVAALRAFKDVLRGLALAETALHTPPLDYPTFYDELRGAVEAAAFRLPHPGGILAASVSDARGLSFRAVALLGLAEGEFPQAEREDLLLRESDRQRLQAHGLPIPFKLRADEASFFYQAVTRSRQHLLLTRPYLADDGQPWEPSPYWIEARRVLGNPQPLHIRPEDPLNPADAASPAELALACAQNGLPFDAALLERAAILQARSTRLAGGPHEGDLAELAGELTDRFHPDFGWSASKLEAYGTCPFYFYIAYALGLEPRTPPEEGYDVRALGSMLHKILEETYQRAADPADLQACIAALPAIADEVFAAGPAEYGFRPTALWAMQQQELRRILEKTITALAEASQGYTPRHLEAKFGMGNPSLTLQTDLGPIRLHGYIDRIDASADGRLRVMDYKAGSSAISAKHLEEGRRLQLPLYALAARDALNLGEIAGGLYWHIQKAEASSLKLENFDGGVDAAIEAAVAHVTNHVEGIRGGQFQPHPPADGCPSYCPAVGFCWRYKKGH
jgi:ATP-dependent helicase/nuclease subunit B